MARWLTFDGKTASALRKQLPREQVFEHGSRNAVEYASGSNQNLVTLLPTGSSGEVAIAVFRLPASRTASPAPKPVLVEKPPSAVHASTSPQAAPSVWKVVASPTTPSDVGTPSAPGQNEPLQKLEVSLPFVRQKAPIHRVGGILGTRDEIMFEEEEPAGKVKKNWWQRFWDEAD